MKKLLPLLFILLSGGIAKAQTNNTNKAHKLQIGINLGGGITNLATADPFNSKIGGEIFAGITSSYTLGPKLALQLNPAFTRLEVKFARNSQPGAFVTTALNSIDVPLLIAYKVVDKRFGVTLAAGPMASFFMNKDQYYYFSGSNGMLVYVPEVKFTSQSYSATALIALNYKRLSLNAQYIYGLNNISATGYNQSLNRVNFGLGFRIF